MLHPGGDPGEVVKEIRRERLAMEIQRVISEVLCFEVQDPRIRHVTLTRVALTGDGGIARVYYEAQVPEAEKGLLQKALDHAQGFVKKEIASRLRLRAVPQLEFYHESL